MSRHTLTRLLSLARSAAPSSSSRALGRCPRCLLLKVTRGLSTSSTIYAKKAKKEIVSPKQVTDASFDKDALESECSSAVTKLQKEIADIKQGRQNPAILNNLKIPQHDCKLSDIAAVSQKNQKTFSVLVYDTADVKYVSAAIASSGQNLNPQAVPNNAQMLTIAIPRDSDSVRADKLKLLGTRTEQCRTAIRHRRAEAMKLVKSINDSTDVQKKQEKEITGIIERFTKQLDGMLDKAKMEIS